MEQARKIESLHHLSKLFDYNLHEGKDELTSFIVIDMVSSIVSE